MIKAWVRDLAILVIFASMLEMLLPNGSLKKYVKLVIGFFVMLAILNPLLSLFRADYTAFYPFERLPNSKPQQTAINREGAKLQKANEALAVNTYQYQMEQQIRALILTQSEVDDANVQVQAGENGAIQKVQIRLDLMKPAGKMTETPAAGSKVETVRPVKIEVKSASGDTKEISAPPAAESAEPSPDSIHSAQLQAVRDKVVKLIASFYSIKAEAITFL